MKTETKPKTFHDVATNYARRCGAAEGHLDSIISWLDHTSMPREEIAEKVKEMVKSLNKNYPIL